MNDRIPERPLQPGYVQPANEQFDEWDSELMHDLFGKRLAEPMADLLQALAQVEKVDCSFGFVTDQGKAKSFDFLLPKLRKLREAAKDKWREEA